MVETGKFILRILKMVIGIASGLACAVFLVIHALAHPGTPVLLGFAAAFAVLAVVFLISFTRDGSRQRKQ